MHQICRQNKWIDEEKRKEFILLLLEKGSNPSIKDKVFFYSQERNHILKKKNRMEKHVKILQNKMEKREIHLMKYLMLNGQN